MLSAGLVSFQVVSLDDARRKAENLTRAARDGRDAQLEMKRGMRAGSGRRSCVGQSLSKLPY